MATVIDFSAGLPSASAIKAAGHAGAILYCSPGREPWMKGKQPPRSYLDELDREGLRFGFVWQYRKGGSLQSGDAGRGYDGGYADASEALKYLNEVRCSGHPIFFAVDWDITLGEWNNHVRPYFEGAMAKLGRERVGIYGHSRVVHWAMEDDVVAEVAPGRVLGWVTRSWGSTNPDGSPRGGDYAVAFQGIHNVPGPDGVHIDINTIFHDEWGWRGIPDRRRNTPHQVMQLAPVEYPCDLVIDTPDSGWRDPNNTQATVFHTTENSDTTPPENVANWQRNPDNSSSYNGLIGADVTGARTVRTNPENRRPWSAGEPGNTRAIHYAAIGWAKRTRAEWLANPKQLRKFSEIAADHHLRYGRPMKFVDRHALRRGEKGFTSHGEWYHGVGGPAFRSDPGDGFPWDVVLGDAQKIIDQGEDVSFTDDDRRMLSEVHHELTHPFQSRYVDPQGNLSPFREMLVGYLLELDRKIEDIHANMLPTMWERIKTTIGGKK